MEEVIDVVGDFGPVPAKPDGPSFQPEDAFGMSFDASSLQSDSQQLQLHDSAVMMPPQIGKLTNFISLSK